MLQHTIGHRVAGIASTGSIRRRSFVEIDRHIHAGFLQRLLIVGQSDQFGLFVLGAVAQSRPQIGRTAEQTVVALEFVVLDGADDLLIGQIRELIALAELILQTIGDDVGREIAELHRSAPHHVLHGAAAIAQINASSLQRVVLDVEEFFLDESVLVSGEPLRVALRDLLPLHVECGGRRRQPFEFGAVFRRLPHVLGQAALRGGQLVDAVRLAAKIALTCGNKAWAAIAGLELRRRLTKMPAFEVRLRALHIGRQTRCRRCRCRCRLRGYRRWLGWNWCRLNWRRCRLCRYRRWLGWCRRLLLRSDDTQLGQCLLVRNSRHRQVLTLLISLERLLGAVAEITVLFDFAALGIARAHCAQLLLQQRHVRPLLAEFDFAVRKRLFRRRRKIAGNLLYLRHCGDDVRRIGRALVGGDVAAGDVANVTIRLLHIFHVDVDMKVGSVIIRVALAITGLRAQRLTVLDLGAGLDVVADVHVPQLKHDFAARAVEDRHKAVPLVHLADITIRR